MLLCTGTRSFFQFSVLSHYYPSPQCVRCRFGFGSMRPVQTVQVRSSETRSTDCVPRSPHSHHCPSFCLVLPPPPPHGSSALLLAPSFKSFGCFRYQQVSGIRGGFEFWLFSTGFPSSFASGKKKKEKMQKNIIPKTEHARKSKNVTKHLETTMIVHRSPPMVLLFLSFFLCRQWEEEGRETTKVALLTANQTFFTPNERNHITYSHQKSESKKSISDLVFTLVPFLQCLVPV